MSITSSAQAAPRPFEGAVLRSNADEFHTALLVTSGLELQRWERARVELGALGITFSPVDEGKEVATLLAVAADRQKWVAQVDLTTPPLGSEDERRADAELAWAAARENGGAVMDVTARRQEGKGTPSAFMLTVILGRYETEERGGQTSGQA